MEKGTQLSEKVTQILLHEIRNGDFNGLDSLPPEVELAEKFNVSRNVIRESLARLEREGWVVRKHGIGMTATPAHTPSARARRCLGMLLPFWPACVRRAFGAFVVLTEA